MSTRGADPGRTGKGPVPRHSARGGDQAGGKVGTSGQGRARLGVLGGPFVPFGPGRWGLHTWGLQLERGSCSADRPTCCRSPAARPSPFGSWRRDVRLPSAPTHTPLVLSRRGRESGERQTEWQTQLTSFPAGLVPGCALPGRLPSSPARHPVEPVPGVRGQAFWGESVCPALPWRQLFLEARVRVARGRQLGPGQERGTSEMGVDRDGATSPPTPQPRWGRPRSPGRICAGAQRWLLAGRALQDAEPLTVPPAVPSTHGGARGPSWLFDLNHTGSPSPVFSVLGNSREF